MGSDQAGEARFAGRRWSLRLVFCFARRSFLHLGSKDFRNGDGGHHVRIGIEAYAGGNGLADGGFYAFAVFGFPELKGVGYGAISDLGDDEAHLDFILEAEGALEAAGGLYTGPTYALVAGGKVYGKTEGTQEIVLAHFHPPVEIGKVHDAGEIGFGELYGTGHGKFGWHNR